MKIIYYSYTGAHSAVIAAGIHLGTLTSQKIGRSQLVELPLFASPPLLYQLNYYGQDSFGNDLFTLGVGHELILVPKSIISFLSLYKIRGTEIKLINTMLPLKNLTCIGERMASAGMNTLGTRIFLHAMVRDYEKLYQYLKEKQIAVNDVNPV